MLSEGDCPLARELQARQRKPPAPFCPPPPVSSGAPGLGYNPVTGWPLCPCEPASQAILPLRSAPAPHPIGVVRCHGPSGADGVGRPHILRPSVPRAETSAEPSLQAKQLKLKRARLADDLNEKIAQRPGPMELVEKNILPVESSLKEAIIGEPCWQPGAGRSEASALPPPPTQAGGLFLFQSGRRGPVVCERDRCDRCQLAGLCTLYLFFFFHLFLDPGLLCRNFMQQLVAASREGLWDRMPRPGWLGAEAPSPHTRGH